MHTHVKCVHTYPNLNWLKQISGLYNSLIITGICWSQEAIELCPVALFQLLLWLTIPMSEWQSLAYIRYLNLDCKISISLILTFLSSSLTLTGFTVLYTSFDCMILAFSVTAEFLPTPHHKFQWPSYPSCRHPSIEDGGKW